jgi:hypothetical protein
MSRPLYLMDTSIGAPYGSIKPNLPNPLMQAFSTEQATKATPHNAMIAITVAAVAALFITG